MEHWNGVNILELAKDVVNESDVPIEERHVEFAVDRATFEVIKKVLRSDLEKLKKSSVWAKSLHGETVHDKIVSFSINENVPVAVPVLLELSFTELESINIILRYQMDEVKDVNDILFDTFINFNFAYQMASGITSPTFENFMESK